MEFYATLEGFFEGFLKFFLKNFWWFLFLLSFSIYDWKFNNIFNYLIAEKSESDSLEASFGGLNVKKY